MRFFDRNIIAGHGQIFFQEPSSFTKYTNKKQLCYCVGAALYMPATREKIAQEIIQHKHPSLTTIIIDLEDALGDLQVDIGLQRLEETLDTLANALQTGELVIEHLPLLFVRVRSVEQLQQIIALLGERQRVLTGYVFPKFTKDNGRSYLESIADQNEAGYTLYAMPILESADILLKESRIENLLAIREIVTEFGDYVLNVRIGATDFSGLLGVRRTIQHTIYDIQVVRDCLTDIMNIFLRNEPQFLISGPVWEYFGHSGDTSERAFHGLLREVEMDRLNGLIGKTIIHPTHIDPVNAMYVVSHEDFVDAQGILLFDGQIGVQKSEYGNKMNEMKPHKLWAQRIIMRAEVFGVFNPQVTHLDLLQGQVIR